SHSVPLSLREAGFELFPVHPEADRIGGMDVHATLADLPEAPDVVEVFRPAEEAPEITRQAIAAGAKVVWLQEGIRSTEAREIADQAGIGYVEDLCMGHERERLGITKR